MPTVVMLFHSRNHGYSDTIQKKATFERKQQESSHKHVQKQMNLMPATFRTRQA